jgi:UDP-N-acetyl-D-glucosamine dehydrogenase
MLNDLLNKIERKEYTIGIVGLGYVGLPLMWTFHERGMPVIGYDIDQKKVDCINSGTPYIKHLGEKMMGILAKSDNCDATSDFSRLKEADCILMCVPTPLNHHREPDMSFVEKTTETVSKHLKKGQMVILESTTYPGTTEDLIIPILEKGSGLSAEPIFMWPTVRSGKIRVMRTLTRPKYLKWLARTVQMHSNWPAPYMIRQLFRPYRSATVKQPKR